MLLGFMGYVLILNLIQVLRIPLDYLTMAFALWNFSVTGLISVFWKGPMWVQQMYLTVMSSLMVCIVAPLRAYSICSRILVFSDLPLTCSYFPITLGIFLNWAGRVDYMDVVGAFSCLGYGHAFGHHFDSSSSTPFQN